MAEPDARKSLQQLHAEWSACTACNLGQRRAAYGGPVLVGEGRPGGIMFIGDGPSEEDEAMGQPFAGEDTRILRDALEKIRFDHYYVTNMVACRSCEPLIDIETGTPRTRRSRGGVQEIIYRDRPPLAPQVRACQARLWEEIYIVDPVLIVMLGAEVSEQLTGARKVNITEARGRTLHISIPGTMYLPSLTEKRKAWRRPDGSMPVIQGQVRYPALPTFDPSYVRRKIGDLGEHGPVRKFGEDLRLAVRIYERYMGEVFGVEAASDVGDYPPEEEHDE